MAVAPGHWGPGASPTRGRCLELSARDGTRKTPCPAAQDIAPEKAGLLLGNNDGERTTTTCRFCQLPCHLFQLGVENITKNM